MVFNVPDKIKNKTPTTKLLTSTSGDEREHEPEVDEEPVELIDEKSTKTHDGSFRSASVGTRPTSGKSVEEVDKPTGNIFSRFFGTKNKTRKKKAKSSYFF